MKKLSRIKGLIALALCACMFLSTGAVVASADDTNSNIAETHSFVDLPYNVGYSNFGYYNAGYVDYTLKIGLFDATAENFNLKPFDTWATSGNLLTHSTIAGAHAENWKWGFAENSSVVLEVKSKIGGTVQFDFSGATLGGWMDAWPSIFSLYRYNAETKTVDTLARNFQDASAQPLSSATYNHTVAVKAGDSVFFEIGKWSSNDYNIQNIHNGKIIVTPNTVNEVVAGAYAKKLDEKVAGLVQANYAETDWDAINAIVAEFKAGSYDSVDALVGAYNSAVANIDAIKPDLVKDVRTNLVNGMNALVGGLNATNYTTEAWATITAAKDAFLNAAPSLTTESELNALYEEKVAEINAVKPYKQTFTLLDYPSKMNANGYTWIEGEVFDTKLYAGTVNDMKEFDTRGETEHIMFSAELNAGFDLSAPAYYVQNWKWFIGYNAGVIMVYKAEVDLKLTFNNNYLATGHASNGWTEDTAFTYYIVRNGELKKIKEVNAPTRDEDFCGEYYLKAGDMLYIEFNSTVIDVGTTRNAEAPCGMTVEADSTAFDAELYAEQNHDLAAEVVTAINEKKEALESYYATLSESDYSATNWLTLAQYIESFIERAENEVETVADVEALYSEIKANMEAVKTVAQTAKELQDTLKAYADDLQAEYDKLVAENKYSSENKAALDKALADGKAKILAAKSATVGNQEKIKAIAALKAVEVGSAGLDCASSLATTMVMPLMAIAICLFAKKKND